MRTKAIAVDVDSASALERIYREQGARLERAVVLFSGDGEVARDAVAEAFAQALGRGGEIRDPAAWVWRTAFAVAAGELKARNARVTNRSESSYEMPSTTRDLVAAVATLSPKQRASVILHHYAGYSTREVAQMIDSTASAVTVHLVRGRSRLREILREDDD